MEKRNVKEISEIKSLQDLNRLKLEKKYSKELKKLEFQASLIRLQSNLSPEKIKETLLQESQSVMQDWATKMLPAVLLKMFRK